MSGNLAKLNRVLLVVLCKNAESANIIADRIEELERENAALRKDKELLDLLNTHCMSADPIMGRSTYRWTIEHDEPDIRAAIAELRKAQV